MAAPTLGNITSAVGTANDNTPFTRTLTHNNNGNGRLLLFVMAMDSATNNSTVTITATYNSVSMNEVQRSEAGTSQLDDIPVIVLFDLESPATGSNDFSVDIEFETGERVQATALIGISTNDEGGIGTNFAKDTDDGNATSFSLSLTTTAVNSKVFGAFATQGADINGNGGQTAGTGYTRHIFGATGPDNGANDFSFMVESQDFATIASQTVDASWTPGDDSAALAFELLEAEGGTNVAVGLTTETDTAQPIIAQRIVAAGLTSETDTAQSILAQRVIPAGLSLETDTAFDVTLRRDFAVGLSSETDSAFVITPVTAGQTPVEQALETDTALDIIAQRVLAVGLPSETDTAQTVTPLQQQLVNLGLVTETDTALAITFRREVVVDSGQEVDTAFPIVPLGTREIAVGLSSELDSAFLMAVTGGIAPRRDTGGGSGAAAAQGRAMLQMTKEMIRRRREEEEELIMALLDD